MKKRVVSRDDVSVLRAALLANTSYECEYDYDTEYNCSEDGCDNEGICRCGVIVNFQIKKANPKSIIDQLEPLYPSSIEKYCIERLIQHGPAGDGDSYDRRDTGGYYGEEVGNIILKDSKINDILEDLKEFSSLTSDVEKVKFVLTKEYGYLLPEVASITKVSTELVFLSKLARTMRKLDPLTLDQYKKELRVYGSATPGYTYKTPEPREPRGFALKEQGGYRLIDGYHRVQTVAANTKDIMVMLVVGE